VFALTRGLWSFLFEARRLLLQHSPSSFTALEHGLLCLHREMWAVAPLEPIDKVDDFGILTSLEQHYRVFVRNRCGRWKGDVYRPPSALVITLYSRVSSPPLYASSNACFASSTLPASRKVRARANASAPRCCAAQ